MTKVLKNLKEALVYPNDILVYTRNKSEYIRTLGDVSGKIKRTGLWINQEKFYLLKQEVKYLRHISNSSGVKTDPTKIEAVKSFEDQEV